MSSDSTPVAPLATTSELKPLEEGIPPASRASELKPLDGTSRPTPREPVGTSNFRVGSQTDPQKLAGAIASALLHRGGRLELHVIGRDAVYKAMKASAIARGYVAASAYNLSLVPGFEDIPVEEQTSEDAEDVITGMVFVLRLTR